VETSVQETVFWPLVEKPVALVGAVTEMARAEAAKARRVATARIVGTVKRINDGSFGVEGDGEVES